MSSTTNADWEPTDAIVRRLTRPFQTDDWVYIPAWKLFGRVHTLSYDQYGRELAIVWVDGWETFRTDFLMHEDEVPQEM